MRKLRYAIKFGWKMFCIGVKRFTYPLYEKKLTPEQREAYLTHIEKDWAESTIKYSEMDIEIIGKENLIDETCVFVANHQSMLDIPLIMANAGQPMGAMAKKEMKKVIIFTYWMEALGSVFIDRSDAREGLKAILQGVENLKNGRSMLIFPEGTRSKGNTIGEFKKGSLKLATKANVPVIPITVDGTYKGLEGPEKDLKAKMIIHKPIYTKDLSKEDKANLSTICQEIIESAL